MSQAKYPDNRVYDIRPEENTFNQDCFESSFPSIDNSILVHNSNPSKRNVSVIVKTKKQPEQSEHNFATELNDSTAFKPHPLNLELAEEKRRIRIQPPLHKPYPNPILHCK